MKYTTKHILLADDDDDDALLFTEAVNELNQGIKVSHVKDGKEALEFLEIRRPDIVFLDLNMPNVNGLECLQRIRSSAAFNDLPVIIYSTSNNTEYIQKCYAEGANKYLVKPYSYEGIVQLLQKLVSETTRELLLLPQLDRFLMANSPNL